MARTDRQAADAHRDYMAKKSRAMTAARAEVGPLPPIADPARREACRNDIELFAKTYYCHVPYGMYMPIEQAHRELLADFSRVSRYGGRAARAFTRGGGKSTCCFIALKHAQCYGYIRNDVYLRYSKDEAMENLKLVKIDYITNDLLAEDFPEICIPIQAIKGRTQAAGAQTCDGESTNIVWTADSITLPTVRNQETGELYPSSGCRMTVGGLKSGIRGLVNEVGRPDRVIIDDPQNDESAASAGQRRKQKNLINKGIAQLGSQYARMAIIYLGTIIEPGDNTDEFTDRKLRPEWDGKLYRFFDAFPKNLKMWETYMQMRREDMEGGDTDARRAHQYYIDNRAEMDEGAICTLPHAYAGKHVILPPNTETQNILKDGSEIEASAIQKAYNIIAEADGAEVFACEYQNEPIEEDGHESRLTLEELQTRLNNYKPLDLPMATTRLTAFIDVHKTLLYYTIVAWGDDFTGNVIEYGTWPEQHAKYFTMRGAKNTMEKQLKGAGMEAYIYNGLEKLCATILNRTYTRDDGGEFKIAMCMIDANWEQTKDVIYQFCRESGYSNVIPSHGVGYTAKGRQWGLAKKKLGERRGLHWRIPKLEGKRPIRYVTFDTNFWKSFVASRFKTAVGDAGALQVFGKKGAIGKLQHSMFFETLLAEKPFRVEAKGRVVDEWELPEKGRDNHPWDCLVGCAVAASIDGAVLPGMEVKSKRRRKRILTSAEVQERRRRNG